MERRIDLKLLAYQFLFGSTVCPPLYFIVLLALMTVLAWLVLRLNPSVQIPAMLVVVLICFSLQYTGINHRVFSGMEFPVKMSLGRFVELLPAALFGMILSRVTRRIATSCRIAAGLSMLALYVVLYLSGVDLGTSGFSYQGVIPFVGTMGTVCVAVGIGSLHVSIPTRIETSIVTIASLSAGIYYVHILVGKVIEVLIGRHRGWLEAIAVFSLSAVIVYAIKKTRLAWLVK